MSLIHDCEPLHFDAHTKPTLITFTSRHGLKGCRVVWVNGAGHKQGTLGCRVQILWFPIYFLEGQLPWAFGMGLGKTKQCQIKKCIEVSMMM